MNLFNVYRLKQHTHTHIFITKCSIVIQPLDSHTRSFLLSGSSLGCSSSSTGSLSSGISRIMFSSLRSSVSMGGGPRWSTVLSMFQMMSFTHWPDVSASFSTGSIANIVSITASSSGHNQHSFLCPTFLSLTSHFNYRRSTRIQNTTAFFHKPTHLAVVYWQSLTGRLLKQADASWPIDVHTLITKTKIKTTYVKKNYFLNYSIPITQ